MPFVATPKPRGYTPAPQIVTEIAAGSSCWRGTTFERVCGFLHWSLIPRHVVDEVKLKPDLASLKLAWQRRKRVGRADPRDGGPVQRVGPRPADDHQLGNAAIAIDGELNHDFAPAAKFRGALRHHCEPVAAHG